MAAIVIADASTLIALARVNGLSWLQQLFTEVMLADVVLAEVVVAEVLTGRYPDTEAPIRQALAAGWLKTVAIPTTDPALPDLDEGEASSIRLALSRNGPALLLINERYGRAVAQDLGLSVAGTAAVIGMARQRGQNTSARQVFAALHASDFRIAPAVIKSVLDRCGD
jgi:predicted nucleic acid-binding protein